MMNTEYMIDLQEYIDGRLDSMDYEFRLSREHMDAESDIVRDFLEEFFDERAGSDFFRYDERMTNIYDMAFTFGDNQADTSYDNLREWLVNPDHDGEYYFAKVIQEELVKSGKDFDFFKTIQAAQVEETIDAITYAYDSGLASPVIAAMYMMNQGYEQVNEELLDKMGELLDRDNISHAGLEEALSAAQEELGIDDKEVGTKATEEIEKNDVALRYQIANFMEENGFSTYGDLDDLEFSGYSRLGENMIIPIRDVTSLQDFADELRNYAEGNDWDEEIKAQMGVHPDLWSGASVEEVVNCADSIGEALEQLHYRLYPIDKTNGELHGLETVFENVENAEFNYDISQGSYDITLGDGVCPLSFGGTFPEGDEQACVDFVVSDIQSHYEDFDYNDHTREYFGVTERDAMNGFPSSLYAVVEDKKDQKETILKLADAVEEMAKNIELEKDAIIVDDNFVVTPTGRDYDFVAIINNTANEDITLYIDGEEFISVQDGDWVGLTNVDLETLQEVKDDIVVKTASQIKEEREQQNKHKNIDER